MIKLIYKTIQVKYLAKIIVLIDTRKKDKTNILLNVINH